MVVPRRLLHPSRLPVHARIAWVVGVILAIVLLGGAVNRVRDSVNQTDATARALQHVVRDLRMQARFGAEQRLEICRGSNRGRESARRLGLTFERILRDVARNPQSRAFARREIRRIDKTLKGFRPTPCRGGR